jgi:hypothetical protein
MKRIYRAFPCLLFVAALAALLAFRVRHVQHVASTSAVLEQLQDNLLRAPRIGFGKSPPELSPEAIAIIDRTEEEQRQLFVQTIEAEWKSAQEQEQLIKKEERQRRLIQAVVSLCFFVPSLFVVLSRRFSEKDKWWAYGTLGTVLGFWLKT